MPRVPVQVGRRSADGLESSPPRLEPGRLNPALAEQFPWECARHVRAGEKACQGCCGACYFLDVGVGCQLGGMRPMRCKLYPLVPQRDRVLVHGSCPEAPHFMESLADRDPRALALLDVAVAMSDLVHEKGDDQSLEAEWLMGYTKDGFRGPVVWKRGRGLLVPERRGGARPSSSRKD